MAEADLLARLAAIVGDRYLSTAPDDLNHYGTDRTRHWPPAPLAVVRSGSAAEVQAMVRFANRERLAIVPSGGRTGLSGGAVAARGELDDVVVEHAAGAAVDHLRLGQAVVVAVCGVALSAPAAAAQEG